MSLGSESGRVARSLGIVLVFALAGPLILTTLFIAFVLVIGVQIVDLMLEFMELETLRPWLSIAFLLLAFFVLMATIPASALAGLTFAITAVYLGWNSLKTALIVVAVMVAAAVILGFFVSPSENSPFFVPGVEGLRQRVWLALFLFVPAAIAASLCWLFTRPLHRMS